MSEKLQSVLDVITARFGADVLESSIVVGELSVTVAPANLPAVLEFLRDDASIACTQLMDVCGVDYPENAKRFEVVYNLLSITKNLRVRVKVRTNDDAPVPSAVPLFESAGWFEREVWDMYGVFFEGNPDLRRILTDYGFDGHPQRKDFPLTGYVELRYDDAQKKVVYEPVKLAQAYRSFDFLSPWEGQSHAGDEKTSA